MKILTAGHKYVASNFEDSNNGQTIQFIEKKVGENGELETVHDGTTNEELLGILINRLQLLNAKFPCRENSITLTKMQEALFWLEARTKDRIARGVEGKYAK